MKAAVTVLRGNGGTFPSRPEMSEAKACEEPGEGGVASTVILNDRTLACVCWPRNVPSRPTGHVTKGEPLRAAMLLGEFCPLEPSLPLGHIYLIYIKGGT